jgi:hypothetical protein
MRPVLRSNSARECWGRRAVINLTGVLKTGVAEDGEDYFIGGWTRCSFEGSGNYPSIYLTFWPPYPWLPFVFKPIRSTELRYQEEEAMSSSPIYTVVVLLLGYLSLTVSAAPLNVEKRGM